MRQEERQQQERQQQQQQQQHGRRRGLQQRGPWDVEAAAAASAGCGAGASRGATSRAASAAVRAGWLPKGALPAAGLVDEVSVVGSRMLRRHGPLRWGVYGYFLLLHVWFFVVWRDWG